MKYKAVLLLTIGASYANNEFSIEILNRTLLKADGHVMISPFGVWSLMTGITLGASGNSKTQLTKAFGLPSNDNDIISRYSNLTKTVLDPTTEDVTLSNNNFIFLDNAFNIKKEFNNTLSSELGAMITSLDFKDPTSAARIANNLIEKSAAFVSNMMKPDDFAESSMILTNVISFKGLWSLSFNASETTLESFYDENRNVLGKVNMMYLRAPLPTANIREMKASVLQLSYGDDGKYYMLIVLPYRTGKVSDVYNKFANVSLKDIFDKIDDDEREFGLEDVDVYLPRFKISTKLVLNGPLNQMGVYDIFNSKNANFKSITNDEIYISAIVHKADIEVTESGKVAFTTPPPIFPERIPVFRFHANKPFIYFVVEKPSATVIFSGIYSKPNSVY